MRDAALRRAVERALAGAEASARAASGNQAAKEIEAAVATARKAALAAFRDARGNVVRRVRMVERLESKQAICDRRTKQPYKFVKRDSNHRAEVWRLPDGTVKLEVVPTFDAAQEAVKGIAVPRPHPAAKRVMKLHKNDLVAWGEDRRIMRVVKMSGTSLTLAPHREGGNLKKRDADKSDAFRYTYAGASRLKDERVQKLWVTPSGRVMAGSPRLG